MTRIQFLPWSRTTLAYQSTQRPRPLHRRRLNFHLLHCLPLRLQPRAKRRGRVRRDRRITLFLLMWSNSQFWTVPLGSVLLCQGFKGMEMRGKPIGLLYFGSTLRWGASITMLDPPQNRRGKKANQRSTSFPLQPLSPPRLQVQVGRSMNLSRLKRLTNNNRSKCSTRVGFCLPTRRGAGERGRSGRLPYRRRRRSHVCAYILC